MAKADLIWVGCTHKGIPFRHYGIDAGNGNVIHLVSENSADTPIDLNPMNLNPMNLNTMAVRETTLEEFSNGRRVHCEPVANSLDSETTLKRARSRVGERIYNLESYNCEHFARECKTGVPISHQVERMHAVGKATLQGAAKVALTAIAKRRLGQVAIHGLTGSAIRLGRLSPAMFASDAAQCVTTWASTQCGAEPEQVKLLAKIAGRGTAAVVGFAQGGPLGSSSMVALHIASEKASERASRSVRKFLGRKFSNGS